MTLIAVSTASAPVFIGRTRSLPHRSASLAVKSANWSCTKARLVSVSLSSCAWAVAMSVGCEWPKLSAL